jgi:FSR family fosmidomycin resistance protein-like MFS transporter
MRITRTSRSGRSVLRGAEAARLAALVVGHLLLDANQGVLVILLPVLRSALGTSIGGAAALVAIWTLVSSVVQPAFGALCDRRQLPWLVPVGVCAAGFGVALVGLAPSYGVAMAGVVVGGAGTAAFHPEAARRVGAMARRWRATGMSYLSVGGNAGYALGVVVAAPVLVAIGRSGFGSGGLAVAGLGAAADRVGLVTTLAFLFLAVPIPALLLALGIPETSTRR